MSASLLPSLWVEDSNYLGMQLLAVNQNNANNWTQLAPILLQLPVLVIAMYIHTQILNTFLFYLQFACMMITRIQWSFKVGYCAIINMEGCRFGSRYFVTYKRDLLLQIFSIVQIVYDQSQITFFLIQCNFEKNIFSKFPKLFFYQSHSRAFGLTIPKWYNTWVLKIFFVNIFFKNWKKIFWKIFLKKYLQKIFSIPKCYTILESWDQLL